MNNPNFPHQAKTLLLSVLLFALAPLVAFSQGIDGPIQREGYGLIRTNISTSHYTGWGNVKDGVMAKISYEMVSSKFLTLTANARYMSVETDFKEADFPAGYQPDAIGINGNHFMEQIGLTSTIKAKVFGKPFFGVAMLNSEWTGGDFERVSGLAVGLFMLKVSRNTQFGIGPLLRFNSNSRLPILFMFLYRHRFNEKWLLNMYGATYTCDYTPSKNDLLSIGADIDTRAFYFSPNDSTLPNRCRFSSAAVRPMVKYRRRLADNLYFDMQTGVAFKISCKVNGKTGSTEYLNGSQKPAPFLQIGASYSL